MSKDYGIRYGAAAGISEKGTDLSKVLPGAFLIICLLLFVSPFIKCVDLAFDRHVAYWMGAAPKVFAFFPVVFILVAHILNLRRGQLSKYGAALAVIGSSLVYLVLSERIMGRALELSGKLYSSDCTAAFPAKFKLEESYQAALAFHDSCKAQHANAIYSLVMTDCPGYKEALPSNPDWAYLQYLEQRYSCAGWCSVNNTLWTLSSSTHQIPCAAVVSMTLQVSIVSLARQVFMYMLFVLAVASSGLTFLGPKLRDLGFDW